MLPCFLILSKQARAFAPAPGINEACHFLQSYTASRIFSPFKHLKGTKWRDKR